MLADPAVVGDRLSQLYRNMRSNIDTEVSRIGSDDSRSPGRAEAAGRQARYSVLGFLRAADQAGQERPGTIGAAPKGRKALLRPVGPPERDLASDQPENDFTATFHLAA